MKAIAILILIYDIFDVFKLIKSEKSNYIKIRNIIFDIAQTLLIFLKLLNYSKLTWVETFIPLYISIGMLIATAEIYFSLKNFSKTKKITKKDYKSFFCLLKQFPIK